MGKSLAKQVLQSKATFSSMLVQTLPRIFLIYIINYIINSHPVKVVYTETTGNVNQLSLDVLFNVTALLNLIAQIVLINFL